MAIDWTLPVGTLIGFLFTAFLAIGSMMRLSWSVQQNIMAQFSDLRAKFAEGVSALKAEIAQQITETQRLARIETGALRDETLRSINRLEGDLRESVQRITALEAGQSEWIKALRARTHELSNEMHKLSMRVEMTTRGIKTKSDEE